MSSLDPDLSEFGWVWFITFTFSYLQVWNYSYVQLSAFINSPLTIIIVSAHKYFLGEPLPPHLSPFMEETRRIGDYVPPEEQKLAAGEEEEEEEVGVVNSGHMSAIWIYFAHFEWKFK